MLFCRGFAGVDNFEGGSWRSGGARGWWRRCGRIAKKRDNAPPHIAHGLHIRPRREKQLETFWLAKHGRLVQGVVPELNAPRTNKVGGWDGEEDGRVPCTRARFVYSDSTASAGKRSRVIEGVAPRQQPLTHLPRGLSPRYLRPSHPAAPSARPRSRGLVARPGCQRRPFVASTPSPGSKRRSTWE